MKKTISLILSTCLLTVSLFGCDKNQNLDKVENTSKKEVTITVAAAASLKNCMDEKLIPMFQEKYPNIKIQGTYDGSGKLQTQIEQGAEIDVFMSAAMKQMEALKEEGLVIDDSINELLENKIVLIVPKDSNNTIKDFEDILQSDKIAIGDPESVPVGQYSKELFENLNIWDKVSEKASFGTNVTEVLTWVAEGSADSGVVYSTDATSNDKVEIVSEAKEGTVSKIIYPVGVVKSTKEEDSARKFVEFLSSDEAIKIFEEYGFSKNN